MIEFLKELENKLHQFFSETFAQKKTKEIVKNYPKNSNLSQSNIKSY
jgi:hypothetical protein